MATSKKVVVKLPRGSHIVVAVYDQNGNIVYVIYTDAQGNMHITGNNPGSAKPLD